MDHIFSCVCHYPSGCTRHWQGTWSDAGTSGSCFELHISGRGSRFTVVFGRSSIGNWICVPELGIGTSLSYFSDVFWNFEKLTHLTNRTDATTIAYALADYSKKSKL